MSSESKYEAKPKPMALKLNKISQKEIDDSMHHVDTKTQPIQNKGAPLEFSFDCTLTIKTVSEANQSEHWTAKFKRKKAQQKHLWLALHENKLPTKLPCIIILTRISPRALDYDNLVGAFKSIRDSLAAHIIPGLAPGRADGDPRINWIYAQQKGSPQSVRIQVLK